MEDIFSTSFSSWHDSWILDTDATCHMTFRRDLFEQFSDNIDGVVYFADKSQIKPSRIGSIQLKIPGLFDYSLNDVLYIHQFEINLLYLVQIRQQGHSIHIFDGKVEIRRPADNKTVMTGVEEDKLLKLKGVSSVTLNTNHLVKQNDTLSSSLLWHACFGHINYESLRIMKQQGIKGLPTVPRNLTPCNACILDKHHKQCFPNSTSRATGKLSLIHFDLWQQIHTDFY